MEIIEILGYTGALFVGLVLGLLGGGGSILTVPILVYMLGFNPIVATAYSLFVVGSSSIVGVFRKYKEGLVDIKTGLAFSFPSFLAVYISRRYIVPNLPDILFHVEDFSVTKEVGVMVFFAIIMILAAIPMIKGRKENNQKKEKQAYYKTFIQGFIIGIIIGIIGAGGGFLYVPALVLWANLSMKKAVGTSLIIIFLNSTIGFLGDLQTLQDINWNFLLVFSGLTIVGVLIGAMLSKYISNKNLKKGFGVFVIVMGIYIFYKELFNKI